MLDHINLLTANMWLIPNTVWWVWPPVWKIMSWRTLIIYTWFQKVKLKEKSSFTILHSQCLICFFHFLAAFTFFRLLLSLNSCHLLPFFPFLPYFFIPSLNDLPPISYTLQSHNLCFCFPKLPSILLLLGCTRWVWY